MKKCGLVRRRKSEARIEAIKKGKFERLSYGDFNPAFFSVWSPEMAWALGLLFTDGNVHGNLIQLTSVDIELLEKYARHLQSLRPIEKRMQSYDKSKHISAVALSHPEMRNDLAKLGLHERKSLTMDFPDVPEEYMRHFIRGCWDGDGSVFRTGDKIDANYTSGSYKFLRKLVEELYKIGVHKWGRRQGFKIDLKLKELWDKYPDGSFPLVIHHKKGTNAYYIRLATRENIERLFHYFYDGVDESMYLKRKYEVFVKGLNIGEKIEDKQLTLDLDF